MSGKKVCFIHVLSARWWWPCSSVRPGMACSVASEPCLLQRRCVCRLILERRRGGHGTGRSVGMVAIRIGEAARWWCQVWVTASGMVAGDPLRHDVHVHPHRQGGKIVVPGMGHGLGWCPSASVKLSVARNGSRPWMVAGGPLRHDVHVHPHRPGGKMVVPGVGHGLGDGGR